MRKSIALLLMIGSLSFPCWADKAGFYVGIGIATNNPSSNDDDAFDELFGSENAIGFRIDGGYIWDLGKPGGFHLGVIGAYDNFGKFDGEFDTELKVQAFSALLVIEQEIAKWVDFVFKIGPSFVDYDIDTNFGSVSETRPGATAAIGFVFFPTEYIGIEVAAQNTGFVETDDDDNIYNVSSLSASVQYRF